MKQESASPVQKELKSSETKIEVITPSRDRRAAGPRTEQGKQRSSRNAIKHGIFSGVILLKDESKSRYQQLRRTLFEDRQPVGVLEEILVEEMVSLLWRKRRLRKAERAEILEAREQLGWLNLERRGLELKEAGELGDPPEGLMEHSSNPFVIDRLMDLLGELRNDLKERGPNFEPDAKILKTIYGEDWEEEPIENLARKYMRLTLKLKKKNLQPGSQGLVRKGKKAAKKILKWTNAEIRELSDMQREHEEKADEKVSLMQKRRLLPSPSSLETLMWCEAHLNRAFDRALNQLERLQRMRRGQPVPPPIKVDVTS
jgi:hypothetical protein